MSTPARTHALRELRPAREAYRSAFLGLLGRDLYLLRKDLKIFIPRTAIQPLLLVFVFTYVFPKTGQGVGGSAGAAGFSTQLVAGVIAMAILMQGVQGVALPLVQEFGVSKEIEDRVLAPLPTWMVGVQKILTGQLQGLFAALLVFPISAVVPATKVHLDVHWLVLLTIGPLVGWVAGSMGLVMGTKVKPQQVSILFAVVLVPITFLGCTYFPWQSLSKIAWLKWAVLINPMVYMAEGLRAALVSDVPHLSLPVIYAALVGFGTLCTWIGVRGFESRVVT